MVDFQIFLDNQQHHYFPGSTVSGYVFIRCSKPIKARNVIIGAYGYSYVEWTESQSSTDSDGSDTSSIETYSSNFKLLDQQIKVWERHDTHERFPEGENRFFFSFQLPYGLPPSYKSFYGNISYKLEARINVPWWLDKVANLDLNVSPFYDLNLLSGAAQSVRQSIEKTYGFFSKNKISISAQLDKSAYAFEENIHCTIEIQNHPKRFAKSIELLLIKTTVCKAQGSTKHQFETTASNKLNIDENDPQSYHKISIFVLPNVQSFSTQNIVVSYEVKVRICINGKIWNNHPEICFPIQIGTVPAKLRVD
ncbi:Arrestin domain-containing protein 2-like protein [Aphelenchoides bicaudatus]|nr:Arrestin domain-containing protein 2-like protein [Aphelenchoides bicaudatus]